MYWEAEKPPFPNSLYWKGNIQGRINAGGGEKTVNFNISGPSAVTLRELKGNGWVGLPLAAIVAGLLVFGAAVVIYRRGLRRAQPSSEAGR